jgi:hypothetical protein
MAWPKTIRLSVAVMHDYGIHTLSDRAFRVWIYLRCAESYFGGCFPDDKDVAYYCRIHPLTFKAAIKEMLEAKVIERSPDGRLANIARPNEAARVNALEWMKIRAEVFERDDYTCTYCGVRGGKLECDHILPHSRGGPSTLENLTTACFSCNRSKLDKTLEEWRGLHGSNTNH